MKSKISDKEEKEFSPSKETDNTIEIIKIIK